ncbi:hypothetical protein CEP51_001651 [Fusarium floridanum]|uniref:Uncharacterized protein n=1 Tax=Fusarium floridanum TaxID=1325733 RepID=A0A428SFJ6_9HYPO|nr:hypothetical protein CEP51_001651 [Fusarium floridanum]
MSSSTPNMGAGAGSQPQLVFGFHSLHEELQRLRQEVIADAVILQPEPAGKKPGLLTYNSPRPCMEMHKILEDQTSLANLTDVTIGPRVRKPQAFQLSVGHDAWVPEGYLGRAILLSQFEARIQIRNGDALSEEHIWKPNQELYYNGALLALIPHLKFSLAIYKLTPHDVGHPVP